MTLRQLQWAADGRLRAEWEQTAMIVAKIHNAHYTKPVQLWEIGPYARTKQEMNLELEDVAGLLKGFQGVTVCEVAAGDFASADSACAESELNDAAGIDDSSVSDGKP